MLLRYYLFLMYKYQTIKYMHHQFFHKHNKVSNDDIDRIVSFVKDYYSGFPEGDLYGY